MPKSTKPTGAGKRYPLNMRTTREVRERLEAAAASNGRSLAQEVENRLERSFYVDVTATGEISPGLAELLVAELKEILEKTLLVQIRSLDLAERFPPGNEDAFRPLLDIIRDITPCFGLLKEMIGRLSPHTTEAKLMEQRVLAELMSEQKEQDQ